MNINDFIPHDFASTVTLVAATLSVLKWIMRKEVSEPLEEMKKSNESLANAQRESNEANMKRFDAIDKVLDHHEIELARHGEQIVTLFKQEHDR
jgi:hypothetical protein